MRLNVVGCVGLGLGILAGAANADIVTIAAGRDNTLFEDETGSLSNGSGTAIFAGATTRNGVRRGLLSFKVQDFIPEGAVVTRAELVLYCDHARGSNTAMGLYAMEASWGEGASFTGLGGGVQAERGDATWTSRFYDIGPSWSRAGGDFASEASATINVGGAFRSYTWGGAGVVADVQRWVDNPEENFGWMLKAINEAATGQAKRFVSREGDPANRQPKLIVEYTIVPAPGAMAVLAMGGLVASRRRR